MTQTKNTGLMVQHLNIIRTGKSGAIRRAGEKGQVGRGGGVKFGTSKNTFTDSRGRPVSDFGTSAYKMDRGFSLSRQEYERTQGKHAAGVVGRRFSKDVRGRAARLGVGSAGEMLGASGQQGRMGVHAEGRVGRGGGGQKGLTPGEQRGFSPNKALYVEDQATKAMAKKLGVKMGEVGGPGTPENTTGGRSWDIAGEEARGKAERSRGKAEAEKAAKIKKAIMKKIDNKPEGTNSFMGVDIGSIIGNSLNTLAEKIGSALTDMRGSIMLEPKMIGKNTFTINVASREVSLSKGGNIMPGKAIPLPNMGTGATPPPHGGDF